MTTTFDGKLPLMGEFQHICANLHQIKSESKHVFDTATAQPWLVKNIVIDPKHRKQATTIFVKYRKNPKFKKIPRDHHEKEN